MISDPIKEKIEGQFPNVQVLRTKRSINGDNVTKETRSSDNIMNKFKGVSTDDRAVRLRHKFLGESPAADLSSADASDAESADQDVEVGLIRRKSGEADTRVRDPDTVIISKREGMFGAQG